MWVADCLRNRDLMTQVLPRWDVIVTYEVPIAIHPSGFSLFEGLRQLRGLAGNEAPSRG